MTFTGRGTKFCPAIMLERLLVRRAKVTGRLPMWQAEQFGAACEVTA